MANNSGLRDLFLSLTPRHQKKHSLNIIYLLILGWMCDCNKSVFLSSICSKTPCCSFRTESFICLIIPSYTNYKVISFQQKTPRITSETPLIYWPNCFFPFKLFIFQAISSCCLSENYKINKKYSVWAGMVLCLHFKVE